MNCAIVPALSFGIFDHLDHAGGSVRQQYSDRLEIAAACDEAGFRAYHVAEHHATDISQSSTDFSSRRRYYRHYGYRHYRPYYRSYGYAPRPYYGYGGGYGGPYYGGGFGYCGGTLCRMLCRWGGPALRFEK